jgi:hypothetical protein
MGRLLILRKKQGEADELMTRETNCRRAVKVFNAQASAAAWLRAVDAEKSRVLAAALQRLVMWHVWHAL